jgi:two-component system sensor histidine kinase DegS
VRLRICLDRVYKEALHNVVKHARADQVKAVLGCRGTTVTCLIQDNGVGFDVSRERQGHYGLRNMQRRVEALGGRVILTSRCGRGTALTIELPLT